MNTREKLKADLQIEIDRATELMSNLDNLEGLEKLELDAVRYLNQIDFDRLTHPQIIEVIKAIGGKWRKTPDEDGTINYEATFDGLKVRMWRGQPPPNCKVIEEIVEEPARLVTRRKLVCQ